MWSAVTWCMAAAVAALGASAARSAWRARELASQDRLGTHFRWHRRGWIDAVVGNIAVVGSGYVGSFAAVAAAEPSRKAAVLQAGIDATLHAPAGIAFSVALGLSGICLFWLGLRNGYMTRPGK